jgi:hypothetical protein
MNLKLKTDSKLPHHYIIGVCVYPATAGKQAGKIYLKYRPIHFTNKDVESMQHAAMLAEDKLFKTTNSEAIAAVGCERLSNELSSMKMAASANQCTLHHFSTEFETDEESFETIVKLANNLNYYKDLLKKSSIRG